MRQASLSKLRQFLFTIAVTCLAFASSPGWAKDQVRVAGLTWPGYGWWYLAQAKNLAPDLAIAYKQIEDPFQSFALMSSGQLDIVSSTAEYAPIGASQNMPIRMFAYGNLSHGTDKIVLRPEIKEAVDLKGKKVAVMVGGLPQIMMGIYLEKNGLPFDSVEYVNVIMDQAAAAMISGTVGGAELWEPFGTQSLKAIEGAKVVASTVDPEWAQNALIADGHFINTDWAKNNRGVALKALKAMYDAVSYWKKNPEEANRIIADRMKMSVADVELVIGKNGTGLDSGLYPYTFIEAAQFLRRGARQPALRAKERTDGRSLQADQFLVGEVRRGEGGVSGGQRYRLRPAQGPVRQRLSRLG